MSAGPMLTIFQALIALNYFHRTLSLKILLTFVHSFYRGLKLSFFFFFCASFCINQRTTFKRHFYTITDMNIPTNLPTG